ncbi:MAG TPA: response regulator transcription factor [Thermoleophilaceae bacterium]|nr:response regulator transcription factor [Thermoleophilaceae bacterium]
MSKPELSVEVQANGSLRPRIVELLEADGVKVVTDSADPTADIRIVAVDISQPASMRHLRDWLSEGKTRPVLLVSPRCDPLGARRAIRAGADSLVLEQELEGALVPAVRAVAAGLTALPADLQNGVNELAFSYRERQVLRLAIDGHTNREIAGALFLAESTVKTHLSSAYGKLGAGGRKDAAAMVLDPDQGLVEIVMGAETSDAHSGLPQVR